MSRKFRVIVTIVITIILLAAAVLIWANQTGKITIWGAGETCIPEGQLCISVAGSLGSCCSGSRCEVVPLVTDTGYCRSTSSPTVSTSSNPTNWINVVKTGSENPTQEFNVTTTVTPEPTTTGCDKVNWTAESTDPKLTLKGSGWQTFSNTATGYWLVKGHSCMPPVYEQTFTAKYDTTGLAVGTYTSKISLVGTYLTNTSSTVEIPITITVTDTPPTPDTQSPTAPTNVQSSNTNNGDVLISWNAATDNVGVSYYQIIAKDSNKNSIVLGSTKELSYLISGGNGCNFVIKGCRSFYVVAVDAAGNRSPEATVTSGGATSSGICPSCADNGGATSSGGTTPTSGTNIAKLVSTGQVLWFNILVALLLSGIILYLGFKKPKGEKNEF